MAKVKTKSGIEIEDYRNINQLQFLRALLLREESIQKEPIKISVQEKHAGIKWEIEVVKGMGQFLCYKLHTEGLWLCWENEEDIEKTFKILSLI